MDIELYKPHSKQREVHNLLNRSDDLQDAGRDKSTLPYIITVCSGRQSGKTELAKNQLLIWALKYPDAVIWFVSPTDNQALKVYREFTKPLIKSGLVKSTTGARGSSTVVFTNGAKVEFKSAKSSDNLRGASVSYLICDETAYFQDRRILDEVLLPTLSAKGRRILLLSTPRGSNFFQYYFNRGSEGNAVVSGEDPLELKTKPVYTNSGNNQFGPSKKKKRALEDLLREEKEWFSAKFRSFRFLSEDNPAFDKSLLPTYLELLGQDRYEQEFMAEFNSKAGVFRNIKKQSVLNVTDKPVYGKQYVCGIDVGLKGDAFCAIVLDSDCNVCWIERHQGISAPKIRSVIKNLQERFNMDGFLMEQNGLGLPILQELTDPSRPDYMTNLGGFLTTHNSKERIVFSLAAAIESGKLSLLKPKEPNADVLISELGAFGYQVGRNGHITLGGVGSHDDCVMALSIAHECLQSRRYSGLVFV
jgi:hypothetical protein